jgi:hypothetical protein
MKLTIGEAIVDRNPRDAFVLYLKVMHGDADGYSTEEIMRVPNDEANLEDLYEALRLIDEVAEADDQEAIPGIMDSHTKLDQEWPYDSTCAGNGDGTRASYEEHWVRYYDTAGVEFSVKVEI